MVRYSLFGKPHGKEWQFFGSFKTKARAQKFAKIVRQAGAKAEIITSKKRSR